MKACSHRLDVNYLHPFKLVYCVCVCLRRVYRVVYVKWTILFSSESMPCIMHHMCSSAHIQYNAISTEYRDVA